MRSILEMEAGLTGFGRFACGEARERLRGNKGMGEGLDHIKGFGLGSCVVLLVKTEEELMEEALRYGRKI